MTVIVRDDGFHAEDFTADWIAFGELSGEDHDGLAVTLSSDTKPESLTAVLPRLSAVRVEFPAFSDGRGFTIGKELRRLGFAGRLRAAGHVIADQYAMVRRVGFDEVEISADLAARQPADQWRFRSDWRAHDYLSRLRG